MMQFLIAAPRSGSGKTTVTCAVLTALQRRGVFHREYEGRTLREHLGLKRPGRHHKHHRATEGATHSDAAPAAA